MRLLFLGDISGRVIHVGDEAMLEANVALFRRLFPDCSVQVAAGAGWDGSRTGAEVNVVPRLEFSTTSEIERDSQLESICSGACSDHPAVRAALECDALVISGGGNLSGSWPHYIYERVAMARLAASKGIPVVMLGQTLGPVLNGRERVLVAELLHLCHWVGMRETYSYALALELGAEAEKLSYQLDDASFLKPEVWQSPNMPLADRKTSRPWIAVTLHPYGDASIHNPLVKNLAAGLRTLAREADADLVFVPHYRVSDPADGLDDVSIGEALARALYENPPLLIVPALTASQVVGLTQQASMIVSTRYHPLVFGLAGGVPSLGIWTDEYTRRKLQGALIHAGRPEDGMPISEVLAGGFVEKAIGMWRSRAATSATLHTRIQQWTGDEASRGDKLRALLRDHHHAVAQNATGH
jgi:polysaccharide pyruvyl transferase WcaK-like protein